VKFDRLHVRVVFPRKIEKDVSIFLLERVPWYNTKTVEGHKEKRLFWKSKI
jgi:hypothetical protein